MISDILNELGRMDLSTRPYYEIHALMQRLGKHGVITVTIPAGKQIIRARPNEGYSFSLKEQLSYKPAKYNTTFQRASTPNMTMFYGSIVPGITMELEINNERIINACEASSIVRNRELMEGEEIITFGKWVTTQDIDVVAIIHHSQYKERTALAKELSGTYSDFIAEYPEQFVKDSLAIAEFYASEFGKELPHNAPDYMYMHSAIYTERVCSLGIPGVLFPTVRGDGKGFNVALSPYVIDNGLIKLVGAVECNLYKKYGHVCGDNVKQVYIEDDANEFHLELITDPNVHIGRDQCYQQIERMRMEG